ERYVAERERLLERQRTQRAWADKGVRRSRTKATDGDKFIRHFRAEGSENQAAKVRATERAIERLEEVDKPWEGWQLQLSIESTERSGDVVARLDGAVVRPLAGGGRARPAAARRRGLDRLGARRVHGRDRAPRPRGPVHAREVRPRRRARAAPLRRALTRRAHPAPPRRPHGHRGQPP